MSRCIILHDRVFERFVLFYEDGHNRIIAKTFEEAQAFTKAFPHTLKEVPINSKVGQQILKRIGSQTTQL